MYIERVRERPCTLHPAPSTVNPQPCTLNCAHRQLRFFFPSPRGLPCPLVSVVTSSLDVFEQNLHRFLTLAVLGSCCRADSAHVRQSGPHSGPGFRGKTPSNVLCCPCTRLPQPPAHSNARLSQSSRGGSLF